MRCPGHPDVPPSYHAILMDDSEGHPPEKSNSNDTKGSLPSPVSKDMGKSTSSDNTRLNSSPSSSISHEIYISIQNLLRDLVQRRTSNSPAVVSILSSCADACATYGIPFSHLLQERYIEKRTVLYWVVVTRLPDAHPTVEENKGPDVLTALLSYASPLKDGTITDIRQACLAASDQNLFKRLAQFPGFARMSGTDQMLLGVKTPLDEIELEEASETSDKFTVNFVIPLFHKRMAISKQIPLEFIIRSRLWRLTFFETLSDENTIPAGSWLVSLSLQETSPPIHVKSVLSILEAASSYSPISQPPLLLVQPLSAHPPTKSILWTFLPHTRSL